VKVDTINKKILSLLQKDARMTYKEIANELQRSETTVRDRIKAMEDAGIIKGYTTLIDKEGLGLDFYAMVLANPPTLSDLDAVTKKITKIANVLRVYQIAGTHKLAIFIVAPSFKALKELLTRRLGPLGIKDEKIIMILESGHEFLAPLDLP
jgi:Lrp/AsnC family transcriptional regulator for asnA, asnC and gidA